MKVKKMHKILKKCFTLAETLVALITIGVLMVLTVKNMSIIAPNNNLSKFKKAYSELESAVNFLLNNEIIYGTAAGFKETNSVTLSKVGETLGQDRVSKFRDGFKYHLHYVEDRIDCEIYKGKSSTGCFRTGNGIVWGIPDTDFVSKNTITLKDGDGDNFVAVPLTFYPEYKSGQTVEDDGFVAAVTYNGKITLINTDGVNCTEKSTQAQCNINKFVQATTLRSDN